MAISRVIVGLSVIAAAVLAPLSVPEAAATSYYPWRQCAYRGISGACLDYGTHNYHNYYQPYSYSYGSYGAPRYTYGPYGNRSTLRNAFTASQVQPHTWDNRYPNRYNYYRYEEDDDDNDYFDDDDDFGQYWYDDDDDGVQWYYDEDDDNYRPYRKQAHRWDDDDDHYYDDDDDWYHGKKRGRNYEYEHTRVHCYGHDCSYYRNR